MNDIERYFRILGLTRDAALEDVKKAYLDAERRLQHDCMCHDAGQFIRAQERLLELKEAYEKVVRVITQAGSVSSVPNAQDERISQPVGCLPFAPQRVTLAEEPPVGKVTPGTSRVKISIVPFVVAIVALSAGVAIGFLIYTKVKHPVPAVQTTKVIKSPAPIIHPALPAVTVEPAKPVQDDIRARRSAAVETTKLIELPASIHRAVPAGKVEPAKPIQHKVTGKKSVQKVVVAKQQHKNNKTAPRVRHREVVKRTESPLKTKKVIDSAIKGDAEAQYTAGVMYANGVGVKKDETESIKWLRKSAEQGNVKAQQALESVWRTCCKRWNNY